jgi:hypothetical protein
VVLHGAGNGLHRRVADRDATTSAWPYALGGATGDRYAGRLSSNLSDPLQRTSPYSRADSPQDDLVDRLFHRAEPGETAASIDFDRSVPTRSNAGRPHRACAARNHHSSQTLSAARVPRAVCTVRMDGTPFCMRKVRVRGIMKRQQLDRGWCRDHNSRLLFPQNSNRHLPFLFHDARVELGLSATEC